MVLSAKLKEFLHNFTSVGTTQRIGPRFIDGGDEEGGWNAVESCCGEVLGVEALLANTEYIVPVARVEKAECQSTS